MNPDSPNGRNIVIPTCCSLTYQAFENDRILLLDQALLPNVLSCITVYCNVGCFKMMRHTRYWLNTGYKDGSKVNIFVSHTKTQDLFIIWTHDNTTLGNVINKNNIIEIIEKQNKQSNTHSILIPLSLNRIYLSLAILIQYLYHCHWTEST